MFCHVYLLTIISTARSSNYFNPALVNQTHPDAMHPSKADSARYIGKYPHIATSIVHISCNFSVFLPFVPD